MQTMGHNISTFEFVTDEHTRRMFVSAYHTITRLEKWSYLREYVVDPEKGFMMSREPSIVSLIIEIDNDYGGHSGGSMSVTLRHMQFLAKYGMEQFRAHWIRSVNNASRSVNHASAVQRHQDVHITSTCSTVLVEDLDVEDLDDLNDIDDIETILII